MLKLFRSRITLTFVAVILVGLFITSCSSHGSGKHRNHMKNDMGW